MTWLAYLVLFIAFVIIWNVTAWTFELAKKIGILHFLGLGLLAFVIWGLIT